VSTNVWPRTRVLGCGCPGEPEAPSRRSAVIFPAYPGQPSGAELARQAALGIRPRKDYVELARALDADFINPSYMAEQASRVGRELASRMGILAGEWYEAYAARMGRVGEP